MPPSDLIKAIAVTAELTGTELTETAKAAMVQDLSVFPVEQVMTALVRCRRELKGRLRVADVIERLDDGRPGVEEAWALCPKDESQTAVWTDEVSEAFGVASQMLDVGDQIAARMAFKEKYIELVTNARNEHRPVRWWPTLGHSVGGREGPLREAVERGRLSVDTANKLLPEPYIPLQKLLESA